MACRIFRCEHPGEIVELSPDEVLGLYSPAQFCIVRNYDSLYEKASASFGGDTPYALPGKNKSIRRYLGIDREPLDHTPEDMDEYSEDEAFRCFHQLEDADLELIYYRVCGAEQETPTGLELLGYDAGYTFGRGYGDGFSAVCDCMFLARWHGCDKEGTEFAEEFHRLNENGLFGSQEQALAYLFHYLNQDWAETGDFCVMEIYRPRLVQS